MKKIVVPLASLILVGLALAQVNTNIVVRSDTATLGWDAVGEAISYTVGSFTNQTPSTNFSGNNPIQLAVTNTTTMLFNMVVPSNIASGNYSVAVTAVTSNGPTGWSTNLIFYWAPRPASRLRIVATNTP